MSPKRVPHRGLTFEDIRGIEDKSVRDALLRAMGDRRISDSEVDDLIAAAMNDVETGEDTKRRTSQRRRLDNAEIKALWLVADKSSSLSKAGREKLVGFLREAAGNELMYAPDERDGWGLIGEHNFPGPGFYGEYRNRPRTLFDLGAKVHDTAYQLNGINVVSSVRAGRNLREPKAQSRKAKSDYLFRQICEFSNVSGFWYWASKQAFDGEDRKEFLSGDGFLNPLVEGAVYAKLCDPAHSLTIPLTHVAAAEERYLRGLKGDLKYTTAVASDKASVYGFDRWLRVGFGPILANLTITGSTGP